MTTANNLKALYVSNGAIQSENSLFQLAKAVKLPVTRKDVRDFLRSQVTWTVHRGARYKFLRRPFYARGKFDCLAADLADVRHFKSKYHYILVAKCVLTLYVFAEPLRRKTGPDCAAGFRKILTRIKQLGGSVRAVVTDFGTDFYNSQCKELFREFQVNHYSTRSPVKSSPAEITIRALKGLLFKLATERQTTKGTLDFLPKIVADHNGRVNADGYSPVAALRMPEKEVFFKRYHGKRNFKNEAILKKATKVRILLRWSPFKKAHMGTFSQEIYEIVEHRLYTYPVTYILKSLQDQEILSRKFYRAELQPTTAVQLSKPKNLFKPRKRII